MELIPEIQQQIRRIIREELDKNDVDIKSIRESFNGSISYRLQTEVAHMSVGLIKAYNIVDAVLSQAGNIPVDPL